jgi:hypothetical protein
VDGGDGDERGGALLEEGRRRDELERERDEVEGEEEEQLDAGCAHARQDAMLRRRERESTDAPTAALRRTAMEMK